MTMAHFIITGESVTRAARDLMLSDDPGKAWRLIADHLIGEGVEQVTRRLLAGEINLVGDSSSGIGIEDADPNDVSDYIESVRYIYAGRVRLQGQWYRPYGVVVALGPDDARHAGSDAGSAPSALNSRAYHAWSRRRAEFYASDDCRVECIDKVDGGDLDGRYVVFEPCSEPPQWLRPSKNEQEAVSEYIAVGRSLEILGADRYESPSLEASRIIDFKKIKGKEADDFLDLAEAAEDEIREAELGRIADQVRRQAGADLFAMTLLDGRVVQVPRAPFVHWALSRLPAESRPALPVWSPVSPSGLKMYNDDPYHSDWILGAGLSLAESYEKNVTSPAWEMAGEMQIEEVDRAYT